MQVCCYCYTRDLLLLNIYGCFITHYFVLTHNEGGYALGRMLWSQGEKYVCDFPLTPETTTWALMDGAKYDGRWGKKLYLGSTFYVSHSGFCVQEKDGINEEDIQNIWCYNRVKDTKMMMENVVPLLDELEHMAMDRDAKCVMACTTVLEHFHGHKRDNYSREPLMNGIFLIQFKRPHSLDHP